MESDYRYYSRRAAEEQRRARYAVTPEAARTPPRARQPVRRQGRRSASACEERQLARLQSRRLSLSPTRREAMVLPVRIELTTSALPRMRSTTELRQPIAFRERRRYGRCPEIVSRRRAMARQGRGARKAARRGAARESEAPQGAGARSADGRGRRSRRSRQAGAPELRAARTGRLEPGLAPRRRAAGRRSRSTSA